MAKRLKRSRRKGWRKPDNAVIVDRTSRWGNPFRLEKEDGTWWVKDQEDNYWAGPFIDYKNAAEKACGIYRGWVIGKIGRGELDITKLKGKDLICFCDLDKPCHADVLLEIASNLDKYIL